MLNTQLTVKIRDLCEQFSLEQVINEPTHYTEHSSSLFDVILTSNKDHLILSGVGDPSPHRMCAITVQFMAFLISVSRNVNPLYEGHGLLIKVTTTFLEKKRQQQTGRTCMTQTSTNMLVIFLIT